jgi:hypothetical protein
MPRRSSHPSGGIREGLRAAAIALLERKLHETEARIRPARPDDDATYAAALLGSGLDVERRRLRDLRAARAVQFGYLELPEAYRPDLRHGLYELRSGDELVPVPTRQSGQPTPREWLVAAHG